MRFAALAAFFALAGCPKPVPAVPTTATATKGLVICWNDAENKSVDEDKAFLVAFRKRLESAGYDLTSSLCDVTFAYSFRSKGEHGEQGYTEVTLTLSDAHGVVDHIKLEFEEVWELPTSDHDRLAILLVNAMNKSDKLAQYVHREHADEPLRKTEGDAGAAPNTKNLIQDRL